MNDNEISLTREQIRYIVHETLMVSQPQHDTIRQVVHETLLELGVQHNEPMEMQKDFQHLREWRVTMEKARSKSVMAVVGFLLTGVLALFAIGFKHVFNQ